MTFETAFTPSGAVKLRQASMADEALLFAWRNDYESRANSFSKHTPEIYRRRMENWLSDPDCVLLIAEVEGKPVGSVRINPNGELSWVIAPEARGKGYGRQMVSAVSSPDQFARIKAFNVASQKIAFACGFRLAQEGEIQVWRR